MTVLAFSICSASALAAQGVRINFEAWTETVLLDTLRQNHELHAPPEKVYDAALHAFADMDIPVGNTAGNAGIIGSERFFRTRSLNGRLLSKSFNCGEGPAGPYADAFRLEIAVVAYVERVGTGTRLGLASVASANDPTGPRRTPRACASTGEIETKILESIAKRVGG